MRRRARFGHVAGKRGGILVDDPVAVRAEIAHSGDSRLQRTPGPPVSLDWRNADARRLGIRYFRSGHSECITALAQVLSLIVDHQALGEVRAEVWRSGRGSRLSKASQRRRVPLIPAGLHECELPLTDILDSRR